MGWVALVFALAAVAMSAAQWQANSVNAPQVPIFDGLLVFDNFTIFLRLFLYGFTALVIWLSLLSGIPDRQDSADFHCLLLGAAVGMAIMASANHLLMVYIGVEMASLPSYALAGFLKGKRQGSEAALKYVVYGGGASGVMLYGISLLAGKFGTAYLPNLAYAYTAALSGGLVFDPLLLLGTMFVLIGIGFKLAAVPFHFWCPDVFEGAAAEVAGFLSVASKGAALALLGRFVLMLAGLGSGQEALYGTWLQVVHSISPALAFFAALTATFGNLAAYFQTNLKRLLAYSTIAHAGIMMMGLAPLNREGVSAVLVYLVAYLFMNLGAFAVVAFLRNETGSEDLSSFRGLIRRAPFLVVTLSIFLLSLLGIPPLAGFVAKFQIFYVLYYSGQKFFQMGQSGLGATMIALLVIGGLNTVLSVFYYLRVIKVMILDKPLDEIEGREPQPLPEPVGVRVYLGLLVAVLVVAGILWGPLASESVKGAGSFRDVPKPTGVAQAREGGL
jgi:NADH-quinone oxidoreductase subunit N